MVSTGNTTNLCLGNQGYQYLLAFFSGKFTSMVDVI